jgi:hypothetical protein
MPIGGSGSAEAPLLGLVTTWLASAQREAWGVGGGVGGWGMAAAAAKKPPRRAGAEATCAYSRGFQISA